MKMEVLMMRWRKGRKLQLEVSSPNETLLSTGHVLITEFRTFYRQSLSSDFLSHFFCYDTNTADDRD